MSPLSRLRKSMVKCRKYYAIDGRACLQRLGESRVQDRHEPTLSARISAGMSVLMVVPFLLLNSNDEVQRRPANLSLGRKRRISIGLGHRSNF